MTKQPRKKKEIGNMTKQRRATTYDRDQHRLICEYLAVSDSPDEGGDTAYEAVVRMTTAYNAVVGMLKTAKARPTYEYLQHERICDLITSLDKAGEIGLKRTEKGQGRSASDIVGNMIAGIRLDTLEEAKKEGIEKGKKDTLEKFSNLLQEVHEMLTGERSVRTTGSSRSAFETVRRKPNLEDIRKGMKEEGFVAKNERIEELETELRELKSGLSVLFSEGMTGLLKQAGKPTICMHEASSEGDWSSYLTLTRGD